MPDRRTPDQERARMRDIGRIRSIANAHWKGLYSGPKPWPGRPWALVWRDESTPSQPLWTTRWRGSRLSVYEVSGGIWCPYWRAELLAPDGVHRDGPWMSLPMAMRMAEKLAIREARYLPHPERPDA